MASIPPEEKIAALVGHRFPGGSYTIEHWENFLLTGCTGAEPLPDGIVHPVALFHVPIAGANTSIAEMFELGQAESDLSIIPEYYDWEMFEPLREEVQYDITGEIVAAERRSIPGSHSYDWVQFRFEMTSPENVLSARTTMAWQFTRGLL